MSLLLATVLTAQLHTGYDLLTLCERADHRACDAYIRETVLASPEFGDVELAYPERLRLNLIDAARRHRIDPSQSARDTLADSLSLMFGG